MFSGAATFDYPFELPPGRGNVQHRCREVCRNHKVKECIKGTESSYPCPMFETPMTVITSYSIHYTKLYELRPTRIYSEMIHGILRDFPAYPRSFSRIRT